MSLNAPRNRPDVQPSLPNGRDALGNEIFLNPKTRDQAYDIAKKTGNKKELERYGTVMREAARKNMRPAPDAPFEPWAQYIELQFAGSDFDQVTQETLEPMVEAMNVEKPEEGEAIESRYFVNNGKLNIGKIDKDIAYLQLRMQSATPDQRALLEDMAQFLRRARMLDPYSASTHDAFAQEQDSPQHKFVNKIGKLAAFMVMSVVGLGTVGAGVLRGVTQGKWELSPWMGGVAGAYALAHPELFQGEARKAALEASVLLDEKAFFKANDIRGRNGRLLLEEYFGLMDSDGGSTAVKEFDPEKPQTVVALLDILGSESPLRKLVGITPEAEAAVKAYVDAKENGETLPTPAGQYGESFLKLRTLLSKVKTDAGKEMLLMGVEGGTI